MRLLALSRAHDVLTRESWDGADLVKSSRRLLSLTRARTWFGLASLLWRAVL